jgi:hypothetical protein
LPRRSCNVGLRARLTWDVRVPPSCDRPVARGVSCILTPGRSIKIFILHQGASKSSYSHQDHIQNINTHTRTHKIRAQSTQTNRDTEASSKASGERQPLPIIRESGAPCQRPAQTAGDRGGAPCSLPYSGGNNPRDSASKQASAHHNSRATSTRTATHAYHHHTTHAGCQSTGVGWPTRVNPHGRKKTRAQTARVRPKPEVKRRGKPDRESGHVGTGGTLAAMRRGLDRERLEPT